MATVTEAIQWIQAQLRALDGVRQSYDGPPDKVAGSLTALAYPPNGEIAPSTPVGTRTDFHNVIVQLQVPLKNIERDYATLVPYIEKAAAVIISDLTWGGNVETITATSRRIPYTLGPATWNGIDILRLQFTVSIKIVQ